MRIGIVLYPDVMALDAIGPFEVLARLPGAATHFVAGTAGEVPAQYGLRLVADCSFETCPPLDLLCVPGGTGQIAAAEDAPTLAFLHRQAEGAQWVTAVCTGSLLLGAAGLLRGYRATTHWRFLECLAGFGAMPVRERVVEDRNRITAAGVSAGLDMGLHLAARIAGERVAQTIQLQLEYDPQPPFNAGSPATAPAEVVEALERQTRGLYERRVEQARRLGGD